MKKYLLNILKHTLVYALCTILGAEIGVLIVALQLGGSYIGILGLMFAWPALVLAAVYTEYVKRTANENKN